MLRRDMCMAYTNTALDTFMFIWLSVNKYIIA